jgi:hypothetical protein
MTIGSEIYHAIATYAERGERITQVLLPENLYAQWIEEGHNINSLFAKLGVSIVAGDVPAPKFYTGEKK